MTKTQIKKAMTAAGIDGELTGRGEQWEIELADEETADLFREKVCADVGGYKTGYGAWVLRPDYKVDAFDFCCTASSAHY